MDTDCPASVPPLLVQWAHISSFYDTVGLYPLIYLDSEHQPRNLMETNCPASVPPLLAQHAHTSSFYDTVGLYPLIYLHSGHHPRQLMYTNCMASFPPFTSGPIPPHFMTQWAYTPSFTYTVGTTLAIYCTQTIQPKFLPYWYYGPIPPHFITH